MDVKCDENWDDDEEFNSDNFLTSPNLRNRMVIRLSPNQKTHFTKKERKIFRFNERIKFAND